MFFQDRVNYISRSRVVLNNVTYPVNAIAAVTSTKITKSVAPAIVGALMVLFAVLCFVNSSFGGGTFCLVVGGGLIAIYVWGMSDRYVLILGTAGMQHHALVHSEWAYVARILEAINNALASRY